MRDGGWVGGSKWYDGGKLPLAMEVCLGRCLGGIMLAGCLCSLVWGHQLPVYIVFLARRMRAARLLDRRCAVCDPVEMIQAGLLGGGRIEEEASPATPFTSTPLE